MLTQVFADRRCLQHEAPFGFPECAARLEGLLAGLEGDWPLQVGVAVSGTVDAVSAVHGQSYIETFERAVARGDGLLGSSDNPLSAGTWEASRAAVEVSLEAADWVAEAPGRHAFAAIRPPGHHAERDLAMGFCYFNNIAIVAEHLRRRHGAEKVAIFDFDVHHGNGTQHVFEERPDVLYVSTHQWPFYPGTGSAGERGRGAGEGATLNVPLPGGSGDEEYRQAIAQQVLPALAAFAPQYLLVSAGFDAWRADPLGGMRVTHEGFAEWGELLREFAQERCGGRLLSLLEGGYDLRVLPELVDRYLGGGGAQ